MELQIQGKITHKLPLQQGISQSGNEWKLQPYVMELLDYPKPVAFEVFGATKVDSVTAEIGDIVTVSFDLESREYNGKWYTTVRAWRIQQGAGQDAAQPIRPVAEPKVAGAEKSSAELPF